MNNWKKTILGEIAEIRSGKTRPQDGTDFPVYGGNGILGYAADFNVENDAIVIGRVGAYCGCVFFEKNRFWLSDNALGVTSNNKSNIKFLYYLLKSLNLNKKAIGGAQPLLTQNIINQIEIIIPSIKEQKQIAAVLSSLDDKIELLRKQNEALEKIAQGIFKEWFVDFRIDGKKLKIKNGLPEGWRIGKLTDIANFLNGLAMQKFPSESKTDYLPVIKIKEMNSGITDQTDKASKDIPEKYIINNGDILFSWSGSLDIDIWKYGKGALNQHLFKVTSEKYPKWFYFYWIKYHLPNFKQIATAKAVTMGHIQRHHLGDAQVIVPEDENLKNSDALMAPIFKKTILNNSQIQTLSRLRDTLLPKLVSGEVRVKA